MCSRPGRTTSSTDHGVEIDLHGTLAGSEQSDLPVIHGDVEGMPVSLFGAGLLHGHSGEPLVQFLYAAAAHESLHRELSGSSAKVSLRDRLAELARAGGAAARRFVPDADLWTTAVKLARNDLFHANPDGIALHLDPRRVQALAGTVTAVLSLRLMAELGFADDDVERLTEWHRTGWADAAQKACA